MNSRISSCSTIVAVVVIALTFLFTADAQFLKKLSKGFEKVNKELEKVEEALQPDSRTTKGQATSARKTSQVSAPKDNGSVNESEVKQLLRWTGAVQSFRTQFSVRLMRS